MKRGTKDQCPPPTKKCPTKKMRTTHVSKYFLMWALHSPPHPSKIKYVIKEVQSANAKNGQNSKEKAMQICALNSKQQFLQSSRSIDLAYFVLKAKQILSPPRQISLSPSQILGNTSLTSLFLENNADNTLLRNKLICPEDYNKLSRVPIPILTYYNLKVEFILYKCFNFDKRNTSFDNILYL